MLSSSWLLCFLYDFKSCLFDYEYIEVEGGSSNDESNSNLNDNLEFYKQGMINNDLSHTREDMDDWLYSLKTIN